MPADKIAERRKEASEALARHKNEYHDVNEAIKAMQRSRALSSERIDRFIHRRHIIVHRGQ